MVHNLSLEQERVLNRLLAFGGDWICAITLQESVSTLDSLVHKGYAQKKIGDYAIPFPKATFYYRAHPNLIKVMRKR